MWFFNYACQVEDNLVREAVKKYSNWPTYPHLYIKGSLVGRLNFKI